MRTFFAPHSIVLILSRVLRLVEGRESKDARANKATEVTAIGYRGF